MTPARMHEVTENESLEIRCLLDVIFRKYGYDFRHYAKASIKRRVQRRLAASGLGSISEMQHRVLYDRPFFERLLLDLSIHVTEMFRDPAFFRALREDVLPRFTGQDVVRIWHAGCATGEEVYSMAILLKESDLLDRARIYATDLNEVVLAEARKGIYPLERMLEYTENYHAAGGRESFADYYSARYDSAILDQSLKRNVVFADHNLATDQVFGEMDLVVCRNVLIYFDVQLQARAVALFADSLRDGGFLGIGSKERLRSSDTLASFEVVDRERRIYRRRDREQAA